MCGIAGYLSPTAQPRSVLVAMTQSLSHRGPDADGFFHDGPVALGHRRLSVLDISGSPQPMSTADGTITVVFNGEIYNFAALREELQRCGHIFRTQGDTETLLYAWREWGAGMLEKLLGMFAFALWDAQQQSLLLARDHLGVKPLHYHYDGTTLVFASELKALLHHPAIGRSLDLNALGLYLEAQFIPAPRSIYRDIAKLEASHALLWQNGTLKRWCYWQPRYTPKRVVSDAEALIEFEQHLRASVASMQVADVALGAFLSGGVDSSLIAALMTDIGGQAIDTFNVGFQGQVAGSEHEYAAQVARHLGSRHHCLMLRADDILSAFEKWVDIFDEPFGDQAALPTLLLADFARQHVTVALTGEGADEVFGGYSNYAKRVREERLSAWLGHRTSPLRYVIGYLPPRWRKDRQLKALCEPKRRRYRSIPNLFDTVLHETLFTPAFRAHLQLDLADCAARFYDECDSPEYYDHLLYIDSRLWLPDDLLTKVDRASMAYSLEARVPYLDHRLFEWAAQLAPGLKQRAGSRKWLLKQLAEQYLPHDIVHRSKQGFVMPLSEWLAAPLQSELQEALSPKRFGRRGIFQPTALTQLLREHQTGRKNHAGRLWALLTLERWFERYAPDFTLN